MSRCCSPCAYLPRTADYLTSENNDGTLTITGYAGSDTDLVIPAEIDGKKVTTIGAAAFDRWYHTDQDTSIYENIQTITVSEGITTFEVYAFSCMPGLIRIEIPKTVVSIETYAFSPKASVSAKFSWIRTTPTT